MLKLLRDILKPRGSKAGALPPGGHDLSTELSCFARYEPVFENGRGLEIGGPSQGAFGIDGFIPVYLAASSIDNCNFSAETIWEGRIAEGNTFVFDAGKPPGRQFVAEATELTDIADSSYDYLLSSHCIEHMANPLKGMVAWRRVLRPGGVLVLVVPHKDGAFDHRRPVTPFRHLLADYEAGTTEADLTHLEEILELHDFAMDTPAGGPVAFRERALRNAENRCLHQHVFDTWLALQVVDWARLQIEAVELFLPMHIAIVARKPADKSLPDNQAHLAGETWSTPFASDTQEASGQ